MRSKSSVSPRVEWVVFDVMGVIFVVGDDVNDLLVPFLQRRGVDLRLSRVRELYVRASLGEISAENFWVELGLGKEYPAIQEDFLGSSFTLDPHFREVATDLKRDYRLAILSNDLGEWGARLRAHFDLNHFFSVVIISGEVNYRKPDRGIYDVLLERTGARAETCFFIDDKLRNLAPAAEIGFQTAHFAREGTMDTFRQEGIEFRPHHVIHDMRDLRPLLLGK